jgi:hypothetical protein
VSAAAVHHDCSAFGDQRLDVYRHACGHRNLGHELGRDGVRAATHCGPSTHSVDIEQTDQFGRLGVCPGGEAPAEDHSGESLI